MAANHSGCHCRRFFENQLIRKNLPCVVHDTSGGTGHGNNKVRGSFPPVFPHCFSNESRQSTGPRFIHDEVTAPDRLKRISQNTRPGRFKAGRIPAPGHCRFVPVLRKILKLRAGNIPQVAEFSEPAETKITVRGVLFRISSAPPVSPNRR